MKLVTDRNAKIVMIVFAPLILTFFFSSGVSAQSHAASGVDLQHAVQSTLLKNETVAQSHNQLKRAEEQIDQTRSAIYPSLILNASYLVQPKPSDPIAAEFFKEHQRTANVTLTQPLFRGLREFAANRRQENLFEAQKQTHLLQLIQLYQGVGESFMDVLAIEQDLRNVEAQRLVYQGRVRDLQARTRRGESSAGDALTAQATAASLDAEFQILSARLRSAREKFSFLTGLAVDVPLVETPDPNFADLKPLESYLARIDERPDIKIAKERANASTEEVAIAKGGHWPTADFVGNYYFVRPEGFMEDLRWDAQIRLSFPIFEGGLRNSQVREASFKRSESELEIARLRRQSNAEIKSLYESLRMRGDQLKALKLSSDLAEKNYQVLQRDSRRGLSRSIDVQLGLTEYRIAKRTYDQARYQARLERIRLELSAAIIPDVLLKEI